MSDADRSARARTRQGRALLRKTRLQSSEADLTPINGADAVALVRQLTAESWSLAGLETLSYTRDRIPWRFVPGRAAREQDLADVKALEAIARRTSP
jgi:hypothetical protein